MLTLEEGDLAKGCPGEEFSKTFGICGFCAPTLSPKP